MVDFVPSLVGAVLLATTALSLAEEVVYSCGGFVKSPVPISYDGISVRLYTSEGNLKYESECAPNNGYYMLPVYTKGEYVLRIKPPKGWKFEPEKVELRVDGETDACSLAKDIDFHFLGFPINGQVRSGDGGLGPTDFPVRLLQHDENDANKQLKLVAQTQTVQSGSYSFAGIMPGAYVIEGGGSSDSEQEALCAARLAAKVVVKDNAVRVTDDLVISGYALGGKIMDNNTPVGGVRVLLFSGEKRKVPNCETTLPSNLSDLKAITPAGLHFICSVLSSPKNGKFTFHCVPPGAYTVLPLYKNVQSGVIFNIKPSLSSITVMSAPAEFTGVPLSGAQATLKSTQSSNQFSATADKNGRYSFPSITSGKYELSVQSDDFEFPKKTVDIKPETAILQDTLPVGLQLCGRVSLDNLPGGVKRLSQRRLTLTDLKTGEAVSISTDESGKFCRMTRQGEYNLQPQLLSDERAAGVKLSPEQLRVTLLDHPVKDALFAQVSATLSGTVTCLADCRSAKLELTEAEGKLVKELSLPAGQQSVPFQIEDVLPAKYELRIISDGVCWGNDRLTVTVKDEDVSGLTFTQTGYSIEITITHDAILNWVFASNSVVHGQANVKAGQNTVCLPAAGKYELKPSACHTFEPASHAVTLGSSPVLERAQFTAVKHSVALRIHLDQVDDSLAVRLRFGSTGEETTLSAGKPAPRQPSGFVYRVEHQCRPGQTITFVPQSKQFLFTPSELQADVEGSCLQLEPITGEKGVFFFGSISPPVAMVHVVMKHKSLEDYKLEGFSDEHGKFSLGPVRHVDQFTFSAKKDGYALEQVAGNGGHFKAMKLSELKISVMDTEGKPLESALVSLSGGPNNYRSNNLTDPATGSILFVGLSAGTYFVRSVLKEYAFEPPGMSVEVRQGITESVTLTGTRFAFSCYGHVRFLAGAGAVGTVVEAVSDACDQLHEQDTCAEDGSYRVRGLKPGCEYRLRVRSEGSAAAGTFPSFYTVQVSRSDVHDYDFSVRPTIVHMDVFGTIHLHLNEEDDNDDGDVVKPTADDERVLKQCRVSVYRERRPDTPLHTAHLNWPGRMFVLRQLPIDAQNYIVRLECAPSSASGAGNAMTLRQLYDNLDSIAPEVVVRANESAKFVHLHFRVWDCPQAAEENCGSGDFQGQLRGFPAPAACCISGL